MYRVLSLMVRIAKMAIHTDKALVWGATMDRYWVWWCKALGVN